MAVKRDDRLAEQTLNSRVAYEGSFLRLYIDEVRSTDGHVGTREYLRHPGAVMIVPLLPDGQVVLERQFRYPLKRSVIEFPAGKIDAGEPPFECAQRELLEETGYRAARWSYLGGLHNAISYSDEKIEMFLAEDLTHEGATLDAGETLEVFTAPSQQLLQWVRDGNVTDVKTMVGAMWLEKILSGEWSRREAGTTP
ncbi:MAG TPA: NUDIX hydrolase [Burkholderiaceae bacterium]|jgi:ADP-ribose pyrophosphatase|nr:NUDIX hydrolase [Burkholderiaceae bacterium]